MNTTTHIAPGLPERAVRATPAPEKRNPIDTARTAPWEPPTARRTSRALIGVVGAALVGGIAIAGVMLSPSNKVHRAPADNAAAQMEQQPTAAGPATPPTADRSAQPAGAQAQATTPATPANPAAADTNANSNANDSTTSPAPTQSSGQ